MSSPPQYRLIRTIGSGVFGYVFEAEHRATKKRLAIKRIQKVGQELSREYQVLNMIQGCENIVKLQDFFFSKNNQGKLVQNMIFEFIDDNLQNLIQRNVNQKTKISEKNIKNYIFQLLKGLDWIHQRNIAHRDLKPENILLSKHGVLKICDFGSSKVIQKNGKNTPYIVSRYYRAPELILSITKYGTQIDIWSVGCIIAQLFLLTPLFKGKSQGDQLFQILNVFGDFSNAQIKQFKNLVSYDTSIFEQFSGYEQQNLDQMFSMVEDRTNFIDLLRKLLCYQPSKRIKAKDALKHPFFSDCQKMQKVKLQKIEITQAQSQISHIPNKIKKK